MKSNADTLDITFTVCQTPRLGIISGQSALSGESNYSAGMNNGAGKLPSSKKTLRVDQHSFYSYKQ